MNTHNLCFEQKYEKISFLSENCQFLEVKFVIDIFLFLFFFS